MSQYKKISVFDLDHTLLIKNSSYLFGIYLYKSKLLSLPSALYCMTYYVLHKLGGLSLQKLHQKMFNAIFYGKAASLFDEHASLFLQEQTQALLSLSVGKHLKKAQDQGHFVVILSSSPEFLVRVFAQNLGVTAFKATNYTVDKNKCFSSLSTVMQGENKKDYLIALSKRLGLPLSEIIGYTDSYLDLPFLQCIGYPIVVNPDRRLKKIAQQKKWDIMY